MTASSRELMGESDRRRRWPWLVAAAVAVAAMAAALAVATGGAGEADAQAVDPADLSLTKSDSPDPVVEDAVLTYTLEVNNAGPDPATNTVVSDQLPSSVDPVSAGNCAIKGKKVTCDLGTLESGGSATVTIAVRPKKDGSITNTASVESDVEDPEPANNEDSVATTVNKPPTPPQQAKCRRRNATIVGTSAGETLPGTEGGDVIKAGGGDDQINAGGGNDLICAGGGNDLTRAGGGNDFAKGQGGRDALKGQRGGDTLKGNRGPDNLRGGQGNDLLAGGKGRDSCRGGRGRDIERNC